MKLNINDTRKGLNCDPKKFTVRLLLATPPSFCIRRRELFLEESADVTAFIQSMAGPLPTSFIDNVFQPNSSQRMICQGFEYTCVTNSAEEVVEPAIVGVVENHRYPQSYVYTSGVRDPTLSFNANVLFKIPSLTHLYLYFNRRRFQNIGFFYGTEIPYKKLCSLCLIEL